MTHDGGVKYEVSVIIPVYNRPDTFFFSLESVLKQDYKKPYEIVIVDNYNDSEESPNLKIIKEKNPQNVVYYHNQENLGMYGNWNRGIQLASADYITYCHDDDIFLPNCLSRLMELQKEVGKKCILSRYNRIDEKGNYISKYRYPHKGFVFLKEKDHYEYTLYNQFIASMGFGVGCLFNRRCMIELGGYNKAFYPSADYALQSSYTYYYGCVINNIPTFNYRVAKNESINTYKQFSEKDRLFRKQMIRKLKYPNCFLNRIILANYRTSTIYNAILWGKQDKTSLKQRIFSDRVLMYIASISNIFKGYGF